MGLDIEKQEPDRFVAAGRVGNICMFAYDDASRAAYTAILADETAESAIEFLWFAVAWYASHGIKVERVLTDNGACYKS